MSRKVLVAGGAGYIGSFVIRALKEEGYDPFVVDNFFQATKRLLKVLESTKLIF